MNETLLNTLYVFLPNSYLHLDHETVRIEQGSETMGRVPLHHLSGVFAASDSLVSPALLEACAQRGISVCWFDQRGRFVGSLRGPTSGNILLRVAQHAARENPTEIIRAVVTGKISNQRNLLLRKARDADDEAQAILDGAKDQIDRLTPSIEKCAEANKLRGYEGIAARHYFGAFHAMIRADGFEFDGRSRRPPRDRVNALMSFAYALTLADCVAAFDGVGLDPQLGYLHEVRPGRPSGALDLLEEFRASLADRLVLTLINRRQITADDFIERPGGAVQLTDNGRKTVVTAYQKHKSDEVPHEVFGKKVRIGLLPHLQARLLARHLRGDLEVYTPFKYR